MTFPIVYGVGAIILIYLSWKAVQEYKKVPAELKARTARIYLFVLVISLVIVVSVKIADLPARLFPDDNQETGTDLNTWGDFNNE